MGDSLLALIHYRAAISRNRYESNSTTVPQANHTSSPNETALFLRMYINCCDTNIALGARLRQLFSYFIPHKT